MKKYTAEEFSEICDEQGWIMTTCNNERNGEYEYGTDTYMVQADEDLGYFGEFVGNEEDGYEFIFYTELK